MTHQHEPAVRIGWLCKPCVVDPNIWDNTTVFRIKYHNMETPPMTRLSDYTTEELTRLTTLSTAKAKRGEYIRDYDGTVLLRTELVASDYGALVEADGECWSDDGFTDQPRRVTSFTDPTELDPPQTDMLAELERRRRPVVSNAAHAGRRVTTIYGGSPRILLDATSAQRMQKGWEADGYDSQYVWAVYPDTGIVVGNKPDQWQLLD